MSIDHDGGDQAPCAVIVPDGRVTYPLPPGTDSGAGNATMTTPHPGTGLQCSAIKADGTPCRSTAVLRPDQCPDGHCSVHCPGRADAMAAARRKGGHNRSNVERAYSRLPDDLRAISRLLAEVIVEVRDQRLPANVGNSVATLARALVGAIESGNLTTRMDDLEALLGRLDDQLDLQVVA